MSIKISIVIPTYEAKGKAVTLLDELLDSIHSQDYKNVEVVISDHSKDDVVKDYLHSWRDGLNIVYLRNERGHGNSSINMNEGIKIASGDFIKIMHMDDMFCDNSALSKMVEHILSDNSTKWGAFGFNHNYEKENSIRREIVPSEYRNERMSESALIGCPSVSFFINDKTNFFDENMIIVNDFDMHHSLQKKYGKPFIIPEICVTIRIHDDQVTNSLSTYQQKETEEMNYFKTKNNIA
jgi:glycosyltransferase involved in cell wall biosynthesis